MLFVGNESETILTNRKMSKMFKERQLYQHTVVNRKIDSIKTV